MTVWEHLPHAPVLAAGDIQVWRATPSVWEAYGARIELLLSTDERARLARFHRLEDRRDFGVAHALVRTLVAHHVGGDPRALVFSIDANGKPHLVNPHVRLEFNLSTTHECVLVVVSDARSVGVDVEAWDRSLSEADRESVAALAFSAEERAAVDRADPHDRLRAFYAIWSRKEAYLKATGAGITRGLDHFDVSADAADARLLADRRTPDAVRRWALQAVEVAPRTSAAVAWDRDTAEPVRFVRCLDATPTLLLGGAA